MERIEPGGGPCRVDPRPSRWISARASKLRCNACCAAGTGQALAQRLRIILACAQPGATNLGVATALKVSRQTVALWRARFATHRLEGLIDPPLRCPAEHRYGAVERLIALTLEEAPANATHWSTRRMARRQA